MTVVNHGALVSRQCFGLWTDNELRCKIWWKKCIRNYQGENLKGKSINCGKSLGDSNLSIDRLAFLVCRGGWLQAVDMRDEIALDQAMDYYDAVVHSDINRADNVQKNPERVRRLMCSYARNQGGQVPNTVLAQDIAANDETSISEETVASYVNALRKIFVVEDMPHGTQICGQNPLFARRILAIISTRLSLLHRWVSVLMTC